MNNQMKCNANYTPLTPLDFLKRAHNSYADRTSIIYGEARFTWHQTYTRCRRLASSLRSIGILNNDVVSVLGPNIPAVYEMHFAVPMAGAVLNTINTRLDANNVSTILRHSEAKILFVDYEYVPLAREAFRFLKSQAPTSPLRHFVIINEMGTDFQVQYGHLVLTTGNKDHISASSLPLVEIDPPFNTSQGCHMIEYEQMIAMGDPNFEPLMVEDEWDPIALNYTSGTTSSPKGVVYSHRGAYLSTLSLILGWEMGTQPVYLWTLPMFHCNGWTFTWGIAARGGTNVCIRTTTASEIYKSIALHGVTHMCCAPIVFKILLEANHNERMQMRSQVQVLTGGAPPPAPLLEQMEKLGFHVVHAYGLTEATGPALVCEWQKKWDHLPREKQARLKARQGITVLTVAEADVKDVKTMESVPRDGKSTGEIVLRGSGIMKGYFKDEKATAQAFANGWFHTGDMGVIHPDGYIEIKDRLKDVIISGGENISSVEVEGVIAKHPKVSEVAVVAMPHPRWGESPCAFIVTKNDNVTDSNNSDNNIPSILPTPLQSGITEQEMLSYCKSNLSGYMVPKKVVFIKQLPKTSKGTIQKGLLRAMAKNFEVPENEQKIQTFPISRL